ncbi:phage portal protein [Paenarthrobacter nitroguajacolicus]|uniref:phage portal protein n=1 Tax=Paenarthrobacter nitroguajacolicus TaxID=211146 RepID=UPI003D1B1ADD
MALSAVELSQVITDEVLPEANKEWARLRFIQKNIDGGLARTWMPDHADLEYKDMFRKASTPWLQFVRDCIAQGLIVDGYSDDRVWREAWQENGMDGRQGALHREVIGLGYSYMMDLPAANGGVVMRPLSCLQTFQVKADPWDEFPKYVLHRISKDSWQFLDDEARYVIKGTPKSIQKLEIAPHDLGFTPVSMIANEFAMDGLPKSQLAPAFPVYKRIVDATFTLQMVQRYGAFPQKWQSGGKIGTDANGNALVRPAIDSLLHGSGEGEVRFGDFAAANITQVANAVDTHIKHLSAVCQVPPHYLLGAIVNMSAEGIAAAESGYFRNIDDHKVVMGEGHELNMRAAAAILGYEDAAQDSSAQMHWQDTSTRSLAQISDSMVKLRTLNAPLEMLFAMIPGWSKADALEAADFARKNGDQSIPAQIQAKTDDTMRAIGAQLQTPPE